MLQHRSLSGLVIAVLIVSTCFTSQGHAAAAGNTAATTASKAHPPRYVVSYQADHKQQLKQQLKERGYKVVNEGPGFLTVTHPTALTGFFDDQQHAQGEGSSSSSSNQAASIPDGSSHRRRLTEAAHKKHTETLSQLPGVHSSEQDVRRHLHIRPSVLPQVHHDSSSGSSSSRHSRTLTAAGSSSRAAAAASAEASTDSTAALSKLLGHWHMGKAPNKAYDQWGADVVDANCAARNIVLEPDAPNSEVVPWGIKEIGAWNPQLQSLPPKGRTIVCVIDSGLWGGHPEYVGNGVHHNTLSGCQGNGSCPFDWTSDIVGHGTHVTGTIAAPQNGVGVVGVIAQGAELYEVRVWNDTGDVSQGQGPYATDLVLAYSHCLSHLKAEQAKEGQRKVNMVINMSYGSAGPLTVERTWIEKAARRGDVLFVASSGNNGSWLDTGRSAGPASMGGKLPLGQYLSYPASYSLDEMLSVANAKCDGSIEYSSQKNKQVSIAAPGMAILSSVPREFAIIRGHISTSAQVTTGAKLRMVGWLANGFLEPRPIQGSPISMTQSLPLVSCSVKPNTEWRLIGGSNQEAENPSTCPAAKGAICFVQLPGQLNHLYEETCTAMAMCIRSGGSGLAVWKPEKGALADPFYSIPATQLDCGPKCRCWKDLQALLGCTDMESCSSKALPGVIISPQHAAALKAAGAGKGAVKGSVGAFEYAYKYFDGTSMAAPHVSGAAALLWRLFPECKASEITHAIKMSAQRLPGQVQVPDYAAGYGMLKVDKAYQWLLKNPCGQAAVAVAA